MHSDVQVEKQTTKTSKKVLHVIKSMDILLICICDADLSWLVKKKETEKARKTYEEIII